jgi:hypothetical protein
MNKKLKLLIPCQERKQVNLWSSFEDINALETEKLILNSNQTLLSTYGNNMVNHRVDSWKLKRGDIDFQILVCIRYFRIYFLLFYCCIFFLIELFYCCKSS